MEDLEFKVTLLYWVVGILLFFGVVDSDLFVGFIKGLTDKTPVEWIREWFN